MSWSAPPTGSALTPRRPPLTSSRTTRLTTPTICSISGDAAGSSAGGSELSIIGTGFLSEGDGDLTTVSLTDTAQTSYSVTVPEADVSVSGYAANSSDPCGAGTPLVQTITVVTPPVANVASGGTPYYVTVATVPGSASGTSESSSFEFTYVPLTPVVSGVSTTSGTYPPGTQMTITGIGFISGATSVELVPTGNGNTLTVSAANVDVDNSTELAANVPTGGTNGSTYWVEVTTTSGGASGTNNGAPEITYA